MKSDPIQAAIDAGILPKPDQEYREFEKNRYGLISYPHKTGGFTQVMTKDCYDRNKKYYVARKGARSCMKRFMG